MNARKIGISAFVLCLMSGSALAGRVEDKPYGAFYNRASGTVIDVGGWSQANGAQVVHWWNLGGDNQRFREKFYYSKPWWAPAELFDGIKLQARHSGRCLDVPFASAYNGAPIIQYDCDNGNPKAQLWDRRHKGDNYWQYILMSNKDYCLDVPLNSSIGTQLVLYRCNDNWAQQFRRF